jgi:hypothetical protein
MHKQHTKKSLSFPPSTMKSLRTFQAKLPFMDIMFFCEDGQRPHFTEKLHAEGKNAETMKIVPTLDDDDDPDTLFVLQLGESYKCPVSPSNVLCFDEFCYRLGIFSSDLEKRKVLLQKAEWTLARDCVVCKLNVKNKSTRVDYYSVGWFETLPDILLKKAIEKKLTITFGSFSNAREIHEQEKNKMISFYSDIYGGDGVLSTCLSALPVKFHSVSKRKVKEVDTAFIDVLDLQNLDDFFEYTKLLWGKERMLRNTLDLFDAMVSLQIPWKVDLCKELIYLPCVPSAPNRKPQVYSTHASTGPMHGDTVTIYKCSKDKIKRELISAMFPYLTHLQPGEISVDLMEKEFFRRLKRDGEKVGNLCILPGKTKRCVDTIYCMLPPAYA